MPTLAGVVSLVSISTQTPLQAGRGARSSAPSSHSLACCPTLCPVVTKGGSSSSGWRLPRAALEMKTCSPGPQTPEKPFSKDHLLQAGYQPEGRSADRPAGARAGRCWTRDRMQLGTCLLRAAVP